MSIGAAHGPDHAHEGSLLWTLEEIGRLVSHERQRLRNAHQHRPPDSAAVRDRRLLGLPARARSRQPGARRDHRPAAGERRPRAHAAHRRPGRPRRRAGAAAVRRRRRRRIRASSTFPRPARIRTARSSACRSSIAGCCRACSSCRRSSARTFGADDVRLLVMAGDAAGADRQRGADARAVRRAGAPAARRRWRRTCGGAGTPRRPACSASSIRCCGASSTTTRSRCCSRSRSTSSRSARRSSRCTAASTTPTAGMQEYLQLDAHLGRAPRRRAVGAAGRVLLRRVRPPRVAADLLRRPRHPRRRSHQERVGSRHSARRRRALLRPGLLPAAARSRRLAARGLHRRRSPPRCRCGRRSASGVPVTVVDRDAHRHDRRARLAAVGRPQHAAAARFERRGQPARRPRADGAALRRRRARPHPPGAAARRRRRARARRALGIAPGVLHLNEGHSAFAPLELVRQRMVDRRHRRLGSAAPRRRAGRLHDAHAGAGRPRSLHAGAGRRAPRAAARVARPRSRPLHGPRPRQPARQRRELLHDGAGAQVLPPRQRRLVAARPGVARDVDAALSRAHARSACRSATSPTACTSRPGWRRRCARSTTAISARTGRRAPATPRSGTRSTTSTTASCGRRTRR